MSERLEPILPQVPVEGIAIHIGKAGIGMGDMAEARLLPDGRVGIYAVIRRRILGIFPARRMGYIGHLGPIATRILSPALMEGLLLRLRIIDLTPEHLANGYPPEVYISVWGDPRHLQPIIAAMTPAPIPEPRPASRLTGLRPA